MISAAVLACLLSAEPLPVPAEVADLLGRAAGAAPAEAVRLLASATHPVLLVARAQAHQRAEHPAEAEADFRAAIAADSTLRPAHLGLAQCLAARLDWLGASRAAAAAIDPVHADAAALGFLAGVALRAEDWRLATVAAQQGILRFPDDERLRRIELAVLVQAGRAEEARQAALALVARQPGEAELWRQLAWAAQETGRDDEALAALEAALLTTPADDALRQRLAAGQLARGWAPAALATVRPLLAKPATPAVVLLAARAAGDAGDVVQARIWLDALPEAERTRDHRILSARLAVQAGDPAAARQALDVLIGAGERDATVLTWAGALAEAAGDLARAEMLYRDAQATLRLVAVLLRQGRRDEAAAQVRAYLAAHPDDAQARALAERVR
jgi:predicted Zn-dependent protease